MNVYERFGVPTVINAKGPSTRLSGGIMRLDVAEAMAEASRHCVDMVELHACASRVIASYTGAEAGLVTTGAAAGLLLGTAACITGLDPARMDRLPDTTGMPNEVIVARSQRQGYDHAIRAAGARLVEVGIPDRYSGAGVRDAETWEYAAAIGERTALVHWVADAAARPPLEEVIEVAHAASVPVLVDAAAQLPPVDNLRRFISAGADLVVFSGGKAIGGPQASGILCGRADLIMAAALQCLDMDLIWEAWQPPPDFIDKACLTGLPHHGIGRACKVGKEEIVGLLTALRLFVEEDAEVRRAAWLKSMQELMAGVRGLPHAEVRLEDRGEVPMVVLELDEEAIGMTALELLRRLAQGTPAIHADPAQLDRSRVLFGPLCLQPDDPAVISRRLCDLLGGRT